MSRRWILKPALVCVLVLSGGCSRQPPVGERPPEKISLVPITFAEWQQKLAGYKGDLVVVDMWASWCAPCLQRFPHMVKLHDQHRSRGVRFVSISLDDREDKGAIEQAQKFLVQQKAAFENYRMDENVTDAFRKLELLSIPAVLIYDRSGKLRYRLTGDDPNNQFTNEDVDRAIEELLQTGSAPRSSVDRLLPS